MAARELYDTETLLGVMAEQEAPSTYWSDLLFGSELNFDDEWVDFEKIPSQGRKLAPFVMPLAQGRPVYSDGSRVQRFKPAYIKPKDPVTPTRVMKRRPGEILAPVPVSPSARRDAIIADILRVHREAIDRRKEWMAAQAILNGSVTIAGEDYPTRVIDFGRASGHTITKGSGARWGDSGVSIRDDIEGWMQLMHDAEFGGAPDRLTIGTGAWGVMRKDPEIKDMMDNNFRGSPDVNINRGVMGPGEVRYAGELMPGLSVYVYNDYYTVNGTVTRFMDARDVVLTSSAVDGYRCHGAIQDAHADYQALSIYSRNWIENDPPVEFVMSQSAPLMVPVSPNATLRARVIA
jgi:hypothetical protein